MTTRNTRVGSLQVLVPAVLALFVLGACAKNAPPSEPVAASGAPPPSTTPSPWTSEKPTPTLEMESGADAYNKQGVLKRAR